MSVSVPPSCGGLSQAYTLYKVESFLTFVKVESGDNKSSLIGRWSDGNRFATSLCGSNLNLNGKLPTYSVSWPAWL